MKVNMGAIDSIVRLIAGVGIIAAGISYSSWWGMIGILPLLTGTSRRCPAYIPLHISTRKKDEK